MTRAVWFWGFNLQMNLAEHVEDLAGAHDAMMPGTSLVRVELNYVLFLDVNEQRGAAGGFKRQRSRHLLELGAVGRGKERFAGGAHNFSVKTDIPGIPLAGTPRGSVLEVARPNPRTLVLGGGRLAESVRLLNRLGDLVLGGVGVGDFDGG